VDQTHFNLTTRSLASSPSRRDVLRGLAGAGLRLGGLGLSETAEAKQRKKGKKHKNTKKAKQKQPRYTTVTRTVRQPLTQTFTSTVPLTIPEGAPNITAGKAVPFPAAIEVSGYTNGTITDVNVIVEDFSHQVPKDVDLLLSSNDGRRSLVMSDVGGNETVLSLDLTLDDEAPSPLSALDLSAGTFQPANYLQLTDSDPADPFAAPAPAPDGNSTLSTFDGANPNGTWRLWAMDDLVGGEGSIGGGWALQITAEVDVQVQEHVKTKVKKGNKKGKGRKNGKR
jgi:hypothetical protein